MYIDVKTFNALRMAVLDRAIKDYIDARRGRNSSNSAEKTESVESITSWFSSDWFSFWVDGIDGDEILELAEGMIERDDEKNKKTYIYSDCVKLFLLGRERKCKTV